ncbi:dephospho-CoA kinase [Oceanivirga miroungae]|uniref:Dephospho-CoA kinase n=1 Tax=Oceanivirga miroungae TaxID=1130046 RepID=A0A6I8ME49_9FUSO|nr:dephospho-CoA kinase [Oceanivirga miroungae]VWL85485.1 dephospho-CoA kinase [Oceanivirga miroungae]
MIYGLTGGIASGKSNILKEFKNLGYDILELDKLGHELLFDKNIKNEILAKIDSNILNNEDEIDRKKLGKVVFSNKDKLEILNSILHKNILDIMDSKIKKARENNTNLVIEVPLLFELNLENKFDKVIVTYVDEKTQIERIMKRDNKTKIEAKKVIDKQMPQELKIKKADIVIKTDKDLSYVHDYIIKEFKK